MKASLPDARQTLERTVRSANPTTGMICQMIRMLCSYRSDEMLHTEIEMVYFKGLRYKKQLNEKLVPT